MSTYKNAIGFSFFLKTEKKEKKYKENEVQHCKQTFHPSGAVKGQIGMLIMPLLYKDVQILKI